MRLGRYQHLFRYAAYVWLAAGAVVGLYFSHRYAYRWGFQTAGRPLTAAYIQEDEDADALHLYYSVQALRVYAHYPGTGSVSEQLSTCSLAKIQADRVEQRVIPRRRAKGQTDEADRLTERVREARELIDAVEKKLKR